jgi:hypothetical protein
LPISYFTLAEYPKDIAQVELIREARLYLSDLSELRDDTVDDNCWTEAGAGTCLPSSGLDDSFRIAIIILNRRVLMDQAIPASHGRRQRK